MKWKTQTVQQIQLFTKRTLWGSEYDNTQINNTHTQQHSWQLLLEEFQKLMVYFPPTLDGRLPSKTKGRYTEEGNAKPPLLISCLEHPMVGITLSRVWLMAGSSCADISKVHFPKRQIFCAASNNTLQISHSIYFGWGGITIAVPILPPPLKTSFNK